MNQAGKTSLSDALDIAFTVIARWETLATLIAFALVWALLRYVANPWAREDSRRLSGGESRPRRSLASFFPKPRAKKPVLDAEPEVHDQDDEFPDE